MDSLDSFSLTNEVGSTSTGMQEMKSQSSEGATGGSGTAQLRHRTNLTSSTATSSAAAESPAIPDPSLSSPSPPPASSSCLTRIRGLFCRSQRRKKKKSKSDDSTSPDDHEEEDEEDTKDNQSTRLDQQPIFTEPELTPEELVLHHLESRQYEEALRIAVEHHLPTDPIYRTQWRLSPISVHSIEQYLSHISDDWWILQELVNRMYDYDTNIESGLLLVQFGLQHMTSKDKIQAMRLQFEQEMANQSTDPSTTIDKSEPVPSTASTPSFDQIESVLHLYRVLFLHYSDRLHTFTILHHSAPPSIQLSHLTYSYFLDCDLVQAARSLAEEEQFIALQLLFQHHREELWLSRHEIISAIPESTNPQTYVHLLPMPGMTLKQFEEQVGHNEGESNQPSSPASIPSRSSGREPDWIEDTTLLTSILNRYQEQLDPMSGQASMILSDNELNALQHKLRSQTLLAAGQLDYSPTQVQQFYLTRIKEIDARAGLVNYALSLVEFGANELHVDGLTEAISILRDLTLLIYTHQLDFLSLHEYASLNDFDRLCLVMRKTTPKTIVDDLNTKAKIFFQRNSGGQPGQDVSNPSDPFVLSSATSPLLRRYMLHLAPTRFDLIHALIMASKPSTSTTQPSKTKTDPTNPMPITDHADLISLSLECCYGSSMNDADAPDSETLQLLNQIFGCLPQRSKTDNARTKLLHRYVDEFDVHLAAEEILNKYHSTRPLQFFLKLPPNTHENQDLQRWGPTRTVQHELARIEQQWQEMHPTMKRQAKPPISIEQQALELLETLSRKCTKQKSPPMDDEGWELLLNDLIKLRLTVFNFISEQQIYTMFLHCILAKERWELSRRVLQTATMLSHTEAERLVLDVAKEFLNSAPSLNHVAIKQASTCLSLLPIQPPKLKHQPPTPVDQTNHLSTPALTREWENELTLIDGLNGLHKLGIDQVVPLEIRLAREKQDAIRLKQEANSGVDEESLASANLLVLELLLRSHPHLYTKSHTVMDILRLLGSPSDAAQIEGKLFLIEAAVNKADSRTGSEIMFKLLEGSKPQTVLQREKASALCYQLSQLLTQHPTTTTASGPTVTLIKPKLHLLAHSIWTSTDRQQLDVYLNEFKQLNIKPITAQQLQLIQPNDDRKDQEASTDDEKSDDEFKDPDSTRSTFFDEDHVPSDIERLILASFDESASATQNKPTLDLLSLTDYQQNHQFDESDSGANIPDATDGVLLDLISSSAGVDNPLALSYLLSLTNPTLAHTLLASKLAAGSDGASLSRYRQSEIVELAMRYFSILTLLQDTHPQAVMDAIQQRLTHPSATSSPTSPPAITLPKFEIPSNAVLLECPVDVLHGYIDALSHGYDAAYPPPADTTDPTFVSSKPTFLLSAIHFNAIRLESKKDEYILLNCPNLDHARFTVDPAYRHQSIIELAQGNADEDEADEKAPYVPFNSDELSSNQMFEIATTLCKRYHLNPWELYMERTKALFIRHISVERLKSSIEPFKQDQLLANPIATYHTLIELVWPLLSGEDLYRLNYLFDLCLDCFDQIKKSYDQTSTSFISSAKKKGEVIYEQNKQRMKDHKELLEKIINIPQVNVIAAKFNYKLLLDSPRTCLVELRKLLTEENIYLVSRLCGKIHDLMVFGQTNLDKLTNKPSLFPILHYSQLGGGIQLSDIFTESTSLSTGSSAGLLIDSSAIFMLFLSKSLRKQLDTLIATVNGPSTPRSSTAATPSQSISAWFTQYDRLLKRLSLPQLTQFMIDAINEEGSVPSATLTTMGRNIEIQTRIQVALMGLKLITQFTAGAPTTNSSTSSTSSTSTSSISPVDLYQRMLTECSLGLVIMIGLSSKIEALSKLAMDSFVRHCNSANAASPPFDDAVLQLVLTSGYLPQLLDQPQIICILFRFIVTDYQRTQLDHQRRPSIQVGSFAHSLGILIDHDRLSHALALYYEAHSTHPYLTGDILLGVRLLKSTLQAAKSLCQDAHIDATDETDAEQLQTALNTYRSALAKLVLAEFVGH